MSQPQFIAMQIEDEKGTTWINLAQVTTVTPSTWQDRESLMVSVGSRSFRVAQADIARVQQIFDDLSK